MEKLSQSVGAGGLVETIYSDDKGNLTVDYKQDVSFQFEVNQRLRDNDDHWKKGVQNDRVHVAHIPDGIVHELLKIGVNVYTHPWADVKRGLAKINRLEQCLMTRKQI